MNSFLSSTRTLGSHHDISVVGRFVILLSVAGGWLSACGVADDSGLLTAARSALATDSGPARSNETPAPVDGEGCNLDSDCPAGLECEVEHGVGACKGHGGGNGTAGSGGIDAGSAGSGAADDGSAGSGAADDGSAGSGAADDGSAGSGAASGGEAGSASESGCAVDADCVGGQECEVEHGVGYCKDHGGSAPNPDTNGLCERDADCTAGQTCESIGGGLRACF